MTLRQKTFDAGVLPSRSQGGSSLRHPPPHRGGMKACSRWSGEATRPHQVLDAGGIPACSRWLSEATPPDPKPRNLRTPPGVPATSAHAGVLPSRSQGVSSLRHPPPHRGGMKACSRWSGEATRPHQVLDAGGIPACSRWLSEATPPDPKPRNLRTPPGVPAASAHALDPHQPALPSHFLHQTSRTPDLTRLAERIPLVSRRHRQRPPCPSRGSGGRGRSCPPAGFFETHHLSLRLHTGIEKILVGLGAGIEMSRLPMAGGLRGLHRQCFGTGCRPLLHFESGRTSPGENVPRGVGGVSGKIRCGLRSSAPRLTRSAPSLASLRDADRLDVRHPVVSLVPRSTTGYRLQSLRDSRRPRGKPSPKPRSRSKRAPPKPQSHRRSSRKPQRGGNAIAQGNALGLMSPKNPEP